MNISPVQQLALFQVQLIREVILMEDSAENLQKSPK